MVVDHSPTERRSIIYLRVARGLRLSLSSSWSGHDTLGYSTSPKLYHLVLKDPLGKVGALGPKSLSNNLEVAQLQNEEEGRT